MIRSCWRKVELWACRSADESLWPQLDAPAPWRLRLKIIVAYVAWILLVALIVFDLVLLHALWQRLEWLV